MERKKLFLSPKKSRNPIEQIRTNFILVSIDLSKATNLSPSRHERQLERSFHSLPPTVDSFQNSLKFHVQSVHANLQLSHHAFHIAQWKEYFAYLVPHFLRRTSFVKYMSVECSSDTFGDRTYLHDGNNISYYSYYQIHCIKTRISRWKKISRLIIVLSTKYSRMIQFHSFTMETIFHI